MRAGQLIGLFVAIGAVLAYGNDQSDRGTLYAMMMLAAGLALVAGEAHALRDGEDNEAESSESSDLPR